MRFAETVDLSELERTRRKMMARVPHELATATAHAAGEGVKFAKSHAPFKDRSGNLRRSIHVEHTSSGARDAEASFISPQFYAVFVEKGTKAHDIYPKAAHGTPKAQLRKGQSVREKTDIGTHRVALRWYPGGDNSGKPRFARWLRHKGSKPYPYMQPAQEAARAELLTQLELAAMRLGAVWE